MSNKGDLPDEVGVPQGPCDPGRRRFLVWVNGVLGAAVAAVIGIPVAGFILAPLFTKEPEVWRNVGAVNDFKIGDTVKVAFTDPSPEVWAGVTAKTGAWLRRLGAQSFEAFAFNCAHLGCPVRWIAKAQIFMCPCHGGVYYADGSVAAGPPPRPLFKYPVRVRNGAVEILASAVPID